VWASLVRSPGVSPAQEHNRSGAGKRSISGDLSDDRGRGHDPDAGDGRQPPHPWVAGEPGAQVGVGPADLDGDRVDQAQTGIQPATGADRQPELGQPLAAGRGRTAWSARG
jgi:hypothetical protein